MPRRETVTGISGTGRRTLTGAAARAQPRQATSPPPVPEDEDGISNAAKLRAIYSEVRNTKDPTLRHRGSALIKSTMSRVVEATARTLKRATVVGVFQVAPDDDVDEQLADVASLCDDAPWDSEEIQESLRKLIETAFPEDGCQRERLHSLLEQAAGSFADAKHHLSGLRSGAKGINDLCSHLTSDMQGVLDYATCVGQETMEALERYQALKKRNGEAKGKKVVTFQVLDTAFEKVLLFQDAMSKAMDLRRRDHCKDAKELREAVEDVICTPVVRSLAEDLDWVEDLLRTGEDCFTSFRRLKTKAVNKAARGSVCQLELDVREAPTPFGTTPRGSLLRTGTRASIRGDAASRRGSLALGFGSLAPSRRGSFAPPGTARNSFQGGAWVVPLQEAFSRMDDSFRRIDDDASSDLMSQFGEEESDCEPTPAPPAPLAPPAPPATRSRGAMLPTKEVLGQRGWRTQGPRALGAAQSPLPFASPALQDDSNMDTVDCSPWLASISFETSPSSSSRPQTCPWPQSSCSDLADTSLCSSTRPMTSPARAGQMGWSNSCVLSEKQQYLQNVTRVIGKGTVEAVVKERSERPFILQRRLRRPAMESMAAKILCSPPNWYDDPEYIDLFAE